MLTLSPAILAHFKKNDPKIHQLLMTVPLNFSRPELTPDQYFGRLCDDIISQQLSLKAAATISSRFVAHFGEKDIFALTPQEILAADPLVLRSLGLSHAKIKYVQSLAAAVDSGELNFASFPTLSNEEITRALVAIKGIGQWTAEMFLIFTMNRENVFSWGDLGLRRGFKQIYNEECSVKNETAKKIVAKWSPYATYASLVLWRFQDAKLDPKLD